MALTLVPVVAGAQTARNPFADLFGRSPSQGGELTSVHLRSQVGGQIGQTIEADFDQQDLVPEGIAAAADVSLVGQYLRTRTQALGEARYSYQEYRQRPAFGAPGYDASGRVSFQATTRLSLQGGGSYVHSPFFRLMWLAPQIYGPSVGDGSAILMMSNDSLDGNAGITQQIGKRATVSATATARQTHFEDLPQNDFTSVGGHGVYKHQVSRNLALRAGYAREESRVTPEAGGERYVNEIIDAGVDFAKAFSMGRRTSLTFATETSMVRQNAGGRQFRLNGTAVFERLFLRTWITTVSARRATEFLPGFRGPVFTERGQASLAGYLTKRLVLNANAEGGRGAVGVGDIRQFISYSGNGSLTFAVTRHIGVFGQYVYYQYQMPPDPLAIATVPRLSRQAVSFGVRTWLALIDKEKVSRDPR